MFNLVFISVYIYLPYLVLVCFALFYLFMLIRVLIFLNTMNMHRCCDAVRLSHA